VEYPLPYKSCHDYLLPLHTGDELRFRAANKDVGTFFVQSVPTADSLLLLVPHRKDASSEKALAFESHVFLQNNLSQVALIDTVHRTRQDANHSVVFAETRKEHGIWKSTGEAEELHFNSVASLSPAYYQLALPSTDNQNATQEYLNAHGKDMYVALRVGGIDASTPEELVVFPHLSLADLESAAHSKATARSVIWLVSLLPAIFLINK